LRVLALMFMVLLFSCSQTKTKKIKKTVRTVSHPTQVQEEEVVVFSDSIAEGKITATAQKVVENQSVCFIVNLSMKDVEARNVRSSNWIAAWEDMNSRIHLLSLKQRDPASTPELVSEDEWTNNFKTCTSRAQIDEVKSLILAPKDLPFEHSNEHLTIQWK
jgi:hypothetical protein